MAAAWPPEDVDRSRPAVRSVEGISCRPTCCDGSRDVQWVQVSAPGAYSACRSRKGIASPVFPIAVNRGLIVAQVTERSQTRSDWRSCALSKIVGRIPGGVAVRRGADRVLRVVPAGGTWCPGLHYYDAVRNAGRVHAHRHGQPNLDLRRQSIQDGVGDSGAYEDRRRRECRGRGE